MAAANLRAGYIELIRQLGQLRPVPFVFGGYAEDALLWERTMRDHSDIDVMVRRSELEERLRQFANLGFEHFDTYYELVPGKPQVLNGERDGLHLEVSVLEPDGERGYFLVEAVTSDTACTTNPGRLVTRHPASRASRCRLSLR